MLYDNYITIINVYSSIRDPKYMKQKSYKLCPLIAKELYEKLI